LAKSRPVRAIHEAAFYAGFPRIKNDKTAALASGFEAKVLWLRFLIELWRDEIVYLDQEFTFEYYAINCQSFENLMIQYPL
jgi:hypothetical protein